MPPAAMGHVEAVIISLLVAVVILSALATRIGIPYPILLVLGGAVSGSCPASRTSASIRISSSSSSSRRCCTRPRSSPTSALRADARTITLMSTLLVAVIAVAVAVAMHALVAALPWEACGLDVRRTSSGRSTGGRASARGGRAGASGWCSP
jgi:monovalent cation/hydrogen antiporter